MEDLEKLININLEMEGILRTLRERESAAAEALLLDKARSFAALVEEKFGTPAVAQPEEAPTVEMPVCDNPKVEEVKYEEAEESEVETEDELGARAIEKETESDEPQEQAAPVVNANLAKAFTLNDRFRFKRELFNGNDDDFTDTLQLLSEMETYGEAEDYLLNDMMWNREDATVADFLAILANNMPDA